MQPSAKNLRTCSKGHQYYKRSDCTVCPVCEKERKPEARSLSLLSAPARRALESKGIKTLKQLSKHSEDEILQLHGMGPGSIPELNHELTAAGLSFSRRK